MFDSPRWIHIFPLVYFDNVNCPAMSIQCQSNRWMVHDFIMGTNIESNKKPWLFMVSSWAKRFDVGFPQWGNPFRWGSTLWSTISHDSWLFIPFPHEHPMKPSLSLVKFPILMGNIWVCLKMVSTPKPNGFADHYPVFKWLFHWEY